MACPTCGHTTHSLGCRLTEQTMFLCPRCGTMRLCDGVLFTPLLVERCRQFGRTLAGECAAHAHEWTRLGIAESIGPMPEKPS